MQTETQTQTNGLIDELARRRIESLSTQRQTYQQKNPIASNIHDCARNIVYQVLDWDQKKPFDDWMIARFEEGRRQERTIIQELRQDGFEVIDQDVNGQLRIMVPEQDTAEFRQGEVLTGRIDGLIKWDGKWIPFEVKSVNPNKYNSIKSIDDFRKNPMYRVWSRQMQVYLLGRNAEQGIFILSDCLGHRMYVPVSLDYGEADWILKHLENAARAIKKREYPDRIAYNDQICGRCPFAHVCMPDVIHQGMEIIDSEDLEKKLNRRQELAPLAKEFEELDEEVKDTAKGYGKDLLVGRYSLFLKAGERTQYNVPDEIKKAYAEKVPTMMVKIVQNQSQGGNA